MKNLNEIPGFFRKVMLGIICALLLHTNISNAGDEVIPAGSVIIDVGSDTPTVNNALKPYGLVYELLKTRTTPVKWIINPYKSKDGIDFIYKGRIFKGGPFIVTGNYRTPGVDSTIAKWVALGVRTYTTTSSTTVPVFITMMVAPQMVLDAQNGSLAVDYLASAGIPASAYIFKTPAQLDKCDDIYVMPHADPTWANHSNLYSWIRDTLNGGKRGAFWLNCHAVSVLENCYNPSNLAQQMNTLMKDPDTLGGFAAVPFNDHKDGTIPPPYLYQYPTDPVMQFVGKTDLSSQNGSEQIYLPVVGWRPTTKICVYDGDHPEIPSLSPGQAAQIAYGPGYGIASYGKVMVQAGHDLNKNNNIPDNVNAQRVFLNFLYVAAQDKAIQLTYNGTFPKYMDGGTTYSFSVTAKGYSNIFTYQWTSSISGTFSNPNSPNTTFTPNVVGSNLNCVIACKVLDDCGRFAFYSNFTTVLAVTVPPVALNDLGVINAGCLGTVGSVTIDAMANDTSTNGDPLSFTLLTTGLHGLFVHTGNGVVTYTPNPNFAGSDSASYRICDTSAVPYCATAWVKVLVGSYDAYGCSSSEFYGFLDEDASDSVVSIFTSGITNPDSAIDVHDDQYATMGASGVLVLHFNDISPGGDTLFVYWKEVTDTAIITLTHSIDNVNYINTVTRTLISGSELFYYVLTQNAQYIKITRTGGTPAIDAVEYRLKGCVSKAPISTMDNYNVPEDAVTVFNILGNDRDPQNLPVHLKDIITQPSKGELSINLNHTVTYVSNKDVSGNDFFRYRIENTEGYTDTATVNIYVLDDGCAANQYKSLNTGSHATLSLANLGDGYIQADQPTATNNGSTLDVGKSGGQRRRSVLKFNTTTIPAGAIIESATLSLTRIGGTGTEVTIAAYALTNAFTEGQVSWNKRNASTSWTTAGGDYLPNTWAVTRVDAENGVYNWDLTTLAQNWLNGTIINNGLELIQTAESSVNIKQTFASNNHSNAAYRPTLTVVYHTLNACAAVPNRAPLAQPDSATTFSVFPVNIQVLANDSDVDNNTITTTGVTTPAPSGTAVVNPDGSIKYTPVPTYNGRVIFNYYISDGSLTDTGEIYVQVVNSPPVAVRDSVATNSNTSFLIDVRANDYDPEVLTMDTPAILVNTLHGVATVSGTGIYYTPLLNYTGPDSFQYQVCEMFAGGCSPEPLCASAWVKITVINRAPDAVDDSMGTFQCVPVRIPVTLNDSDPENGDLTISIKTNPSNGGAVVSQGKILYAPNSTFTGTDQFWYYLCDNGEPSICDSALVKVFVGGAITNTPPLAVNDTSVGPKNSEVDVDILNNDSDPDQNTIFIKLSAGIRQPLHGTLRIDGNHLDYFPFRNYVGQDTFEYILSDTVPSMGPGCPVIPSKYDTALVFVTVFEWEPAILDKDDDNDGIPDVIEICGPTALNYSCMPIATDPMQDDDGDAIPNYMDADYSILNAKGVSALMDQDGDGVINSMDLDSDGDGIPDAVEANLGVVPSNYANGMRTGSVGVNGIPDCAETTPESGITNYPKDFWDQDGDGISDYLDIDGDNDGIPDAIEGQPSYAFISPTGTDSDHDGLDNAYDPDNGGTLVAPLNVDGADVPDYRDLDADNDGAKDAFEGFDNNCNGYSRDDMKSRATFFILNGGNGSYYPNHIDLNTNGTPDWIDTTAAGVPAFLNPLSSYYYDTDKDGLVDLLDPDNKGALADPPNCDALNDKDWRDPLTTTPLPIELLSFSGYLTENSQSQLDWATSMEINNDRFEVQHSTDGMLFTKIGVVKGQGSSMVNTHYQYLHLYPVNGNNYYRLKQIDFNGAYEYSQIINIPLRSTATYKLNVFPNPANSEVTITMFANTYSTVEVYIVNVFGQKVFADMQCTEEGNIIHKLDMTGYAAGAYTIEVVINGERSSHKIILVK